MARERTPLQVLPGGKAAGARALAPLSDEALLALIATPEGDLALAELYDRYGRVAYGLAYRVLRTRRSRRTPSRRHSSPCGGTPAPMSASAAGRTPGS